MSIIKSAKQLVDNVARKIRNFHSGEESPLITRFDHFNDSLLGGLYTSMIVVVGGISGSGKSHFLQQLEEDFLNEELNPTDVVLLRCNWEMTVFKLVLRRLKQQLNKTIRGILSKQEISETEQLMYKEVLDDERKDKIFYLEEPCNPDEFLKVVDQFIQDHKDKKHIVISLDHLALVRDLFGSKKKSMDQLIEAINILKKRYSNVSFILISQMNREIETRTNPKDAAPIRGDMYNTDTIFQIADLVVIRHNPWRLKFYEKYMVFPIGTYDYLSKFFEEKSLKGTKWRSFRTKGLIFYHYLKKRDTDDEEGDTRDLYIDYMYPQKKDYEKGITINESQEVFTSVEEIPDMSQLSETDQEIYSTIQGEDYNEDDLPF